MLNLNKYTKRTPKLEATCKFKNISHVCAMHTAQLSYTTRHKTVFTARRYASGVNAVVVCLTDRRTHDDGIYYA